MSKIFVDKSTIRGSGIVPSSEVFTDPVEIQEQDGVQLIVKYLGGGYAAVHIRPQFAFAPISFDQFGDKRSLSEVSLEWIDGQVLEYDSTNNRSDANNDVTRLVATSGVLSKQLVPYDNPGALAVRFGLVGDTLTGPDPGAITIEAVRVKSHSQGRSYN